MLAAAMVAAAKATVAVVVASAPARPTAPVVKVARLTVVVAPRSAAIAVKPAVVVPVGRVALVIDGLGRGDVFGRRVVVFLGLGRLGRERHGSEHAESGQHSKYL